MIRYYHGCHSHFHLLFACLPVPFCNICSKIVGSIGILVNSVGLSEYAWFQVFQDDRIMTDSHEDFLYVGYGLDGDQA
jgi:hypothetical protein